MKKLLLAAIPTFLLACADPCDNACRVAQVKEKAAWDSAHHAIYGKVSDSAWAAMQQRGAETDAYLKGRQANATPAEKAAQKSAAADLARLQAGSPR